jgi:hypothetical protein
MIWLTRVLTWIAVGTIVILAILLPVIMVTGVFSGHPAAGTIALVGLVLLALGVGWYVRGHGRAR